MQEWQSTCGIYTASAVKQSAGKTQKFMERVFRHLEENLQDNDRRKRPFHVITLPVSLFPKREHDITPTISIGLQCWTDYHSMLMRASRVAKLTGRHYSTTWHMAVRQTRRGWHCWAITSLFRSETQHTSTPTLASERIVSERCFSWKQVENTSWGGREEG